VGTHYGLHDSDHERAAASGYCVDRVGIQCGRGERWTALRGCGNDPRPCSSTSNTGVAGGGIGSGEACYEDGKATSA
jgi:hypothetical protein